MRVPPATDAHPLSLHDLAERYAPPPDRPWVRATMVSTLDGAATGADGRSGDINTEADHVVFEVTRAVSDCVLVGAGTARTEGYGPLRLATPYAALRTSGGRPAALPLVVVTGAGRLPDPLRQHTEDTPVLAVTRAGAPGLAELVRHLGSEQVVVAGDAAVDLPGALSALHEKGFRHIDAEGGPALLGDLLAAGLVDELTLTISPLIVSGGHSRIVTGGELAAAYRPVVLVEQDGTVMGRWWRA